MRNANMNIRIDPHVKESADEVFKAIGISTSDGINIFLRKVIAEGGIPFDVKMEKPSMKLLKAIEEGEQLLNDLNAKKYGSAKELFKELNNEVLD